MASSSSGAAGFSDGIISGAAGFADGLVGQWIIFIWAVAMEIVAHPRGMIWL